MDGVSKPLTALVAGGSGLTGSHLISQLKSNPSFKKIYTIGRGKDDFSITQLEAGKPLPISFEIVFCCLGTTIRKAGSKAAFRKVDLELPVLLAKIARENGASAMVVMSSLGADKEASNFYLHVKGEMESLVEQHFPGQLTFVRPSLLLGHRKEQRTGEQIGKVFMKLLDPLFSFGPLLKWKAVHAAQVAHTMVKASLENKDRLRIIQNEEIHRTSPLRDHKK